MKLILSLFLLIPLLIQAQAPTPIKLKEEAKVYKKGKIKTVKIYVESEEEEKFLYSTKSYNKKGELTQTENWEAGTYTWNYTYNKLGLLVKETMEDAGENILEETVYIYGNKNRLIEMKYKDEEYPFSVLYLYDNKGRIDSSFVASAEPRKIAWTYDAKNRVILQIGYTILNLDKPNDWEAVDKDLYEYNAQGKLKKWTSCFQGGFGCSIVEHQYNSNNKKIQTNEYIDDAKVSTTLYEYNKEGFLIKEIYTPTGADPYGNTKKISTYEYEYQ